MLKVAVVGTGFFSTHHYDAWSRCPEAEIVGIATLDSVTGKDIASAYGIPSVFDDLRQLIAATKPDLVDLVVPPQAHAALIEIAIDHGVDVICQKPFCSSLAEAERMVALAEETENTLLVHENFRFQPWYGVLKENLPRLGRIYQATFRLRPGDDQGADAYMSRQPYFQSMERFLVHETAIHLVDVARYLLGDPRNVIADLRQLNPAISGEDAGLILMDMGDGVRVVIDGNRLSDHPAENRRRTMGEVLIEGEFGVLSLNGDADIHFRAHGTNDSEPINYEWQDRGFGGDCVYRFIKHAVNHLLQDKPAQTTARDYLTNLRIAEAIYRSSEEGIRVNL